MRYTNPSIEVELDLGCLGKHMAKVSYKLDDGDIDYIEVDHAPLYVELEFTTLNTATQDVVTDMVVIDRAARMAEAADNAADARRDAASFERTENFVGAA